MYSIVKAQQNLHNDICALLGLMRVFAVGWAFRAGRNEGGYMMNWVDGLGCGVGSGVGVGVGWVGGWGVSGAGIVSGELWIYPHNAIQLITTQSPYNTMSSPPTHDRIRTARHTPFSPPSPVSHPPYPPCLRPTQLHSCANSTPTNSTRPSTISTALRTLPRHTIPPPNKTHSHTSTQPIYPTIHTPHIIIPSKPSPLIPLYAHSAASTRISPSKAHMSLWRFCCDLTIEYKCKTSNINKCL